MYCWPALTWYSNEDRSTENKSLGLGGEGLKKRGMDELLITRRIPVSASNVSGEITSKTSRYTSEDPPKLERAILSSDKIPVMPAVNVCPQKSEFRAWA
jgi:hypothetical protein